MSEEQIRPEDYIYKLIKDKIVRKKLFPNSPIVESKLAESTGISRTPIRAAIKRLNYEGIVTIIPNHGAFISNPTLEEIKAVYECKKLLESAAIKLACVNITDEQLERLEELEYQEIEVHKRNDLYRFIKINDEIHMIIASASKNMVYEKYIYELIQKSNVYLIFYDNFMFTSTDESNALKEHREILNALKARDIEDSAKAIERHNQITLDQLSLNGIVL
ncbi:GntR family transcriptional regulator [Maledivibacter halophilus]|uniref:DNA-binding transcriptional regulator, GntR family n=1 Tax=Maledivibacter halophilus TaxID=36842 RepID=A0A1T5L7Z2_9FIRM|nr:GntR family transcriptional regulator [Maledivibacter halophilus]SKC72132.1 DNA-binding transcriptional regulator, GntR family [Maledivibacter halophilus]